MQTPRHAAYESEAGFLTEAAKDDARATEAQLLVQELTHRFNNDLASMSGFVSLTAARSMNEEVKLALAGVLQRIHDMAMIQRALRMPPTDRLIDGAGYLGELCRSMSCAKLQYLDIELVLLETPLEINAIDCWRMGMIVAELINNAAQHAFRDRGGKIQVVITSDGGRVECSVADNGRGFEASVEGQGTGIIRSIAWLLKGTVEYSRKPGGTVALLSFPLANTDQVAAGVGNNAGGRALQISGRKTSK